MQRVEYSLHRCGRSHVRMHESSSYISPNPHVARHYIKTRGEDPLRILVGTHRRKDRTLATRLSTTNPLFFTPKLLGWQGVDRLQSDLLFLRPHNPPGRFRFRFAFHLMKSIFWSTIPGTFAGRTPPLHFECP